MKKQGIIFVRWANKCNNNCTMCSLHSSNDKEEVMPFEEAADFVRKNAEEYSNIEFTGGEPTVKEGLADLVLIAKECGYERIGISTNGRKLSDKDFCHRLAESGLNIMTFALHGHDAETHEKMSRIAGSFDEAVRGMKNVLAERSISLAITSVLSRLNHKTYHKIGEMLADAGVEQWSISDLIPDGRAYDIYDSLSINAYEMEEAIQKTLLLSPRFGQVGVFNFSRCFFPKTLPRNVAFFDTKAKAELWNIEGKEGRYEKEGNIYHDFHKTYLDDCSRCSSYEACGGIWRRHVDIYGSQGVTEVAKNNGFIEPKSA
jgi:MoaA/NifB/PqqE/SkfB family radical SAM enzyme